MGFLSAYTGTTVIYLDDEQVYWVEVKKYLSQGEKESAESALSTGRLVQDATGASKFEVEPNVARYRQLMVKESIQTWNLDDDNGTVWPITLQNVRRLPAEVFDKIYKYIESEDKTLDTPEARRQFRDEGFRSDQDGLGGATIA